MEGAPPKASGGRLSERHHPMSTSLQELFRVLSEEVQSVKEEQTAEAERISTLDRLLRDAIRGTLVAIKEGTHSDNFADFVVIKLIAAATREGFTDSEIRTYIQGLASDSFFAPDRES